MHHAHLFLMVLVAVAGCSGGSAAYTRFRRASEEGRMVRADEVRAEDFIGYHATADAPRPPPGGGAEAPIFLDARAGAPTISEDSGHVPLMISLRGGVAAYRAPTEVVVVVDVSGSMQEGDKIGAVRHALGRLVERLDPRDHLAIVTFADAAHVALPPVDVVAARSEVLAAIDSLSAYGGTNLYEGLAQGIGLAAAMGGETRRVILLSDGVASVGVRDGYAFEALARQAHDARVSITTVGMGEAIDFALLETLAVRAGGQFHYLDQPSEVERLFGTEIVQLLTLAARDVRIRVTLPAGWELFQSFDHRTERVGDVLETRLGELTGDGAAIVLHELSAPMGTTPVTVPVEVTLAQADGRRTIVARADVMLARSASAGPVTDPMVLRNWTLGRTAIAVRTAAGLAEAGDPMGARAALEAAMFSAREAAQRLAAMGESERAQSLEEPIALLSASLEALPVVTAPATSGAASARFSGWR